MQLSATTTTLSGGRVCAHNDSSVAAIVRLSLCAGTSTVRRNGPCSGSAVAGSLPGGSSGSRTSRTADGPSGVRTAVRSMRISGDSGRRDPAVASQNAHRGRNVQRREPSRRRWPRPRRPPRSARPAECGRRPRVGSRPTMPASGCAPTVAQTAATKPAKAKTTSATVSKLNRATRRRSGNCSDSTAATGPPDSLGVRRRASITSPAHGSATSLLRCWDSDPSHAPRAAPTLTTT